MNIVNSYLSSYENLAQIKETMKTNWKGHKMEILSGAAVTAAGLTLTASSMGIVALAITTIGLCLLGYELFQTSGPEIPIPKFQGIHSKARLDRPKGYPVRVYVFEDEAPWCKLTYAPYDPKEYTAPSVLENAQLQKNDPKRWADPEFAQLKKKTFFSYQGITHYDAQGRPLNPIGRTGLAGRGLLGKWGANQAGDPVITRINPETNNLEILVVQRKDNEQWAIPGGMQDKGELISATCKRELKEETNADTDFSSVPIIYQGYVDDPRNTDNAWMETSVIHVHLKPHQLKQRIQAGDDAKAASWQPITEVFVERLYASHPAFVRLTLKRLDPTTLETAANKNEIRALISQ